MQASSSVLDTSSLKRYAPWLLLLTGGVIGLVFLGMYLYGTFPKLSQDEADKQCAECVESSCPLDLALTDPVKACAALKAAQACSCSGTCATQCRQSINYMPSQCTDTYC